MRQPLHAAVSGRIDGIGSHLDGVLAVQQEVLQLDVTVDTLHGHRLSIVIICQHHSQAVVVHEMSMVLNSGQQGILLAWPLPAWPLLGTTLSDQGTLAACPMQGRTCCSWQCCRPSADWRSSLEASGSGMRFCLRTRSSSEPFGRNCSNQTALGL